MLDKKRSCILDYYEAIDAYCNYLVKYFGNNDYSNEIIILEENMILALLSLISLNLVYKKEDIVENKENLEYDSKLYDFVLDDYLAILGSCCGNKFRIGDFESDFAGTVFAKIRNKLAHGDFYIKDEKIYLNIEGKEKELSIKLLSKFTQALSRCYLSCNKEVEYERNFIIDKATSSNLEFNMNNIESILRLLTLKSYKIASRDNEIITVEIKKLLNQNINKIKKFQNDKAEVKQLEEILVSDFNKLGYNLSIHNNKIKDIEKMKRIALTINSEIEKKTNEEKKYAFAEMIDKVVDFNYSKDIIWTSAYRNQIILENLMLLNEYDLEKLYKMGAINDVCIFEELYVSSLLAKFNVLYSYPLDDIYKKNNAYRVESERIDELNFGLLNLDNINPSYINYKFDLPNELEKQVNNIFKQIQGLNNRINKLNVSYSKVNDSDTKEKIHNLIEDTKSKLAIINYKYIEVNNKYLETLDDLNKNEKYFNNKNIIEGIRNALAHGNVEIINPFEVSAIGNLILNFKDYDNGELCMDLTLTIKEFNTLFSEQNLNVIKQFINKEKNITKVKK